jgi:hypothetical protein
MITELRSNKIQADSESSFILKLIKRKIEISVSKHASELTAIIGYYDCAGNPTDKKHK